MAVGAASLRLHLARPANGGPPRALVFHVTGDSGWFGLDRQYYEAVAAAGYAVAGASARALCADLGSRGSDASATRLASDYLLLIDQAVGRLHLPPDTPIILTGLSRGAGLTVVAATETPLSQRVAGVLIMSLTADERHVRPEAAPFALLAEIPLPLVLLQSTVDHYVAADDARRLAGPDTPSRRMVAVEAGSHTFRGHRPDLFRQVEAGLQWILDLKPFRRTR